MLPKISKTTELKTTGSSAFIFQENNQLPENLLSRKQSEYLKLKLEINDNWSIYNHPGMQFFHRIKKERPPHFQLEDARKAGAKLYEQLKNENIGEICLVNVSSLNLMPAFLEGILLAAYSFSKYKKEKEKFSLDKILVYDDKITEHQINELKNLIEAVFHARDLVNEPLSYLTAEKLSEEFENLGKEAGFSVEVFNKKKIEALKMGGLLAVNRGSIDPPTFTIVEWKPENATNKKPIVLIGKGVVFDTGGLSLKPTAKSMDYMKCDMAGAAAAATAIYAAAKNKLPLHLIGLFPATDNRPDGNAYVPGDIITMYDGTTVEIKNTDAEGRLILADALAYAKKYDPELVIDLATLTGSAEIISGRYAAVGMGNIPEMLEQLKRAGDETYERVIEVPLWEEFAEPLKSAIADLNNLGVRECQTSIAGKFLEHFTGYNWIHLDIAGVAFYQEKKDYRSEGGTGFGTRLLFNFLKKFN